MILPFSCLKDLIQSAVEMSFFSRFVDAAKIFFCLLMVASYDSANGISS